MNTQQTRNNKTTNHTLSTIYKNKTQQQQHNHIT